MGCPGGAVLGILGMIRNENKVRRLAMEKGIECVIERELSFSKIAVRVLSVGEE